MALWDELPADVRNGGSADGLRPLLENVDTPTSTTESDGEGTWRVHRSAFGGSDPLSIDPATGGFTRGPVANPSSTPVEFPDPRIGVELALRLDGGGNPDGTLRLTIATPSAIVRLPFLRGARLDAQGQLRADPARPDVKFLLPAIRIRVRRAPGGELSAEILSAATGPAVDHLYDFVHMDPPHALIGPGDTVGFAFRAAVLDLSGTAGPTGVPPEARAMPLNWQGFWLPEARLFVAPNGLEGLAVSAGVRDLWIGIGRHAGVTGLFEAEVVNRGTAPTVRLRFQTASGEWIGVPDLDSATPVDVPETSTLYVDGGGGIAPLTYAITIGATTTNADRVSVTAPATGTLAIEVRATDAGAHTATRTISVRRRTATGTASAAPSGQEVTASTTTTTPSRVVVQGQTATTVTLVLDPPGGDISWTWPGGGSATGSPATVPVAPGPGITVTVTRTRPAASVLPIDAYFLFDRPCANEGEAFARNSANLHAQPAQDRYGWGGSPVLDDGPGGSFAARLAAIPAGTTWAVEGWASYENDNSAQKQAYNLALSERRRNALMTILADHGVTGVTPGTGHGHHPARTGTAPAGEAAAPPSGDARWRRARATATLGGPTSESIVAQLVRPPAQAQPDPDPRPTEPRRPDFFRKIGVRVELIRSTFVRAELYGEFDIQTAAEDRLQASTTSPPPTRTNPNDGICMFLIRLRIAEDRSSWLVSAEFRAIEGDLDGLIKKERGATGDQTGLDIVGALATLGPLLAAATPPSPTAGELVPMVIATAAAVGIGASGVMQTRYLILRGGELVVTDGIADPATGSGPTTTQVSILLDVETAFTFDLGFIRVRPEQPIVTRYKAVGIRSSWDARPQPDGTVDYVPLPVFDPSKGYTLDVPAGSLVAADPLGQILRILGVRVSRDNPTYLEVEVGMGVDLGIVTVDTVRVRLRLDQPEVPQLTKLGASIDVPGVLHGAGFVEITPFGFKGALDLSITPLNVRVLAVLAVETRDGVVGVLFGAEVEFPVPIPLGNSGLGLYGFLGGVGVNYGRLEPTGVQAPALKWLEDQFNRTPPTVMHPDGWQHKAGSYAFAAGVLLGTAEGGFVVHLKGIVLIEIPGPRLLLVMKADVLKMPPVLKSTATATFLAVLDIDFGRGTITLGVVAAYTIQSLLTIRVPVTAFFDTNHIEQWFVDLGSFTEPVTVNVLDVLTGVGYVMVHGNGIVHPRIPIPTNGLTIAAGFHLQAVLMGSKSVGLYFEVAAGFDALISFEPFAVGGLIYARGELRLFIVGISASAELTVLVGRQLVGGVEVERTYIHGEVCGEVDFFFFSVSACIELTLGSTPPAAPVAPPLVKGVVLISRSPALVEGTATDRVVDGKLADALASGSSEPLPTVPLDAIPAIVFDQSPAVAAGNIVLGGVAAGASGLPANPWTRRGDRWWRYRLTGVELVGALQPAPPAGKTPATWWARGLPGDPQIGPSLALLNWLPTPTPRAVPYGERLEKTITDRWGRVCDPPAEPAPVLWTFDGQPTGPSSVGWRLAGVPWPDAPGTYRSSPVDGLLGVTERWRTGDPIADGLQGTEPAIVVGDAVACPKPHGETVTGIDEWGKGRPATFSRAALPLAGGGLQEVAELLADGTSLLDLPATWVDEGWDGKLGREPLDCAGRILRSPVGDEEQPAPDAGPDEQRLVKEIRDKRRFEPSDLEDSVQFRVDGGIAAFRALLLMPRRLIEQRVLVLRLLDRKATVVGERRVDGADIVGTSRPIPGRWTDPGGPWADPVERAGQIAARVSVQEPGFIAVLVETDLPDDVVEIELGWDRRLLRELGEAGDAFWVVAAEGLVASERFRYAWDTRTLDEERSLLETVLTQDPDDHALLVPGTTYTVRVRWQGQSVEQTDRPAATHPDDYGAEQTQEFRFGADPASEAPTDLGPWILASAPNMNETGVLCREPVRIALATQNVAALFAAYGEELRVLVRAASGHHPEPPGGGGPGAAVTIPVAIGGVLQAAPKTLAVLTPFEEAVGKLVDGLRCRDGLGERTQHHIVEIAYAFEPLTDYLIDVVAVPTGAAASASGRRVHRVGFTTSRFDSVADLADLTRLMVIEHRLCPTPAALAALPAAPKGDQLDVAFGAAGLGAPEVPRYPRVQVLWSPDAVPQPVAVVVESSESMWRARPIPTEVQGPVDSADPGHKWWAAVRRDWLSLDVSTAPVSAGDPPRATVTRIVPGPGGTRAVVLLGAGARGAEVRLDLVLAGDPLAGTAEQRAETVRIALLRAPWEVED